MVKHWLNFVAGLMLSLVCFTAGAPPAPPPPPKSLNLGQAPLYLVGNVPPNIMLMLDNSGSMSNIVPDTPYDPNTTFLASCPSANTVPGGTDPPAFPTSATISMQVIKGVPNIRYGGKNYFYGTTGTGRCFHPTKWYNAKLNASANCGTNCYDSEGAGYLDAVYTGNYLNWYFGSLPTVWTGRKKPLTQSRLEIAQTAAKSLLDSLSNVRVGLATYNGGDGGSLREVLADISTNRASLKTKIDALTPSGNTPLAETLSDIGRYFTTGYSGNLTLHPGQANQSTDSIKNVFSDHSIKNDSGKTITAPIQNFCQQSFVVMMTDGRPQGDNDVITGPLADYDGDCSGANKGNCDTYDKKKARQYESEGSDYLDDVAQALAEMDLRPDIKDPKGKPKKNNVETYMIGFADEQAKADPLMQDTAAQGGGLFIQAEDSAQLSQAFQAAIADISGKTSSAASVALSSGAITSDSHLYQAKFNTANWSGQLLAIPINTDGTLGSSDWDAGAKLNAQDPDSRKIATYKPSKKVGIPFRWPANPSSPGATELDASQVSDLNKNPVTNLPDVPIPLGSERLDYLRGKAVTGFRARVGKLGDSVYSSPAFVGAPQARYPDNWGKGEPESGQPYSGFKSGKAGRTPMVYIGANDGMLHGFDAKDGSERFAYVPGSVFKNLNKLTDPSYNHRFYVDGSPIVGDAFFGGAWRTVLVGGLRGGGQGIYALDVTDPPSSSDTESDLAKKVLWEFTDADDPDLGYSYSDPSIVRLHNGKWAVVFGNGYNNTEDDTGTGGKKSATGNAVLYVVDIADGSLIAKIDTKKGYLQDPRNSSTPVATDPLRPNGLATPAPIDANGDYLVDYVYAGDLFGNLWKFDVNSTSASSWKVGYGSGASPAPLFTACAGTSCTTGATSNHQPITTRPEVGRHPTQPSGFMVYFGTGKYFETGDSSATAQTTQSFYGVWDQNPSAAAPFGRSKLQSQKITQEVSRGFDTNKDGINDAFYNLRVTEKNPVDYPGGKLGWYMDLVDPISNQNRGERQVTDSILRNGRIIFTTLIPSTDPCDFGGTGWLMELNAETGGQPDFAVFDLNGDGLFNQSDYVDLDGDGVGDVPASGKQSGEGIIAKPGIIADPDDDKEYKLSTGSTGNIERTVENAPPGYVGRTSWRELKQ